MVLRDWFLHFGVLLSLNERLNHNNVIAVSGGPEPNIR